MTIPKTAVKEDARLEEAANTTRLDLARHRWHWTLDETNSRRAPVREYARAIGKAHTTVVDMVNGYAAWLYAGAAYSEFGDYQARAKLRGETGAATEAIAEARGIDVDSVRKHHSAEVREVKATAQERAERKGTTPADEVAEVAEWRERSRKAEASTQDAKRANRSVRYISVEGKVAVAMTHLRSALNETEGVEFTAEERDLLADSLRKLRALLNLIDMRVTGASDIDWDAEMARLNKADS